MQQISLPVDGLAALILAAGESARLGRAKPLLLKKGRPLICHATDAAAAVCAAGITVVTGAGGDAVAQALSGLAVNRVQHDNWQQGMGSSLAAGVSALAGHAENCTAVLVMLCDQPRVGREQLAALAQLWQNAPSAPAAAAYAGSAGVPAIFPRGWFGRLGKLHDDRGARDLLQACADLQLLNMPEAEQDVDTPDDLHLLDE